MPLGFGRHGGPERGEAKPLQFSDLPLTDPEKEIIKELIGRHSVNLVPTDYIKDNLGRRFEGKPSDELEAIVAHVLGQVVVAREAANANPAPQS